MTSRRDFLKRSVLGTGLLPATPLMQLLLANVEKRAAGANKPPLRFVFCIKSNGLWAEMIQPTTLRDRLPFEVAHDAKGRLVNGNNGNLRKTATPAADLKLPADFQLTKEMAPLAPFRDRISILQGINSGFSTYHMGCYQTLGAFQGRTRNSREALGPTVDSLLARAFPRPINHVCLGHDPKSPSGVAYVPTSALDRGKPLPFYTKPTRAYKELFGVVDQGAARNEYDVQSGILDFFVDDSKRLKGQVAGPEREQLDRYLDAFESIRKSRQEVEAISDSLRKHAPDPPGKIEPHSTMKVGAGNADIAIASLLSGLTNVVTLRFDLLGSSSYEGIGGLHGGVGHGQVKNVLKARSEICSFQFQQIARIAKSLQAMPEGDGTMLDNTVFVYTSDNGETHHSGGVNYPVLLLGNLGGRLKRNRYFAPGNAAKIDRAKSDYTRLGDLWATLLAAAGQPFESFGIPLNGLPHRPIRSLLA